MSTFQFIKSFLPIEEDITEKGFAYSMIESVVKYLYLRAAQLDF